MALITLQDAQGWVQTTKFTVTSLDTNLLEQIEVETLARIGSSYDTSTWVDASSIPRIVRVAIAKLYVAWAFRKAYSEDAEVDLSFAIRMEANAEMIITGVIDGTIDIPGAVSTIEGGTPSFYPNDASSLLEPGDMGDYSLGPSKFSMGQLF